MNVEAKVSPADGSNLGHIVVVICSLILGAFEFEHMFIVCKTPLFSVIF